jgi:hypothetical protein
MRYQAAPLPELRFPQEMLRHNTSLAGKMPKLSLVIDAIAQ